MSDFLMPRPPENIHAAGYGAATFGSDDRLIVRFFTKPERNAFKSSQAGEPVFDQVMMISIRQPGERDDLHRPVQEDDQYRFPRQWDAFQAGQEQAPTGTALEVLFDAQPEIVTMLRSIRVMTVEQLASATEAAIGRMGMGARGWVNRAKSYLVDMKDAAGLRRLEAENGDLRAKLEVMQQQLQELGDRVAVQTKRGPGRPPKAFTEELEDAA